jgi:hypothetical protein
VPLFVAEVVVLLPYCLVSLLNRFKSWAAVLSIMPWNRELPLALVLKMKQLLAEIFKEESLSEQLLLPPPNVPELLWAPVMDKFMQALAAPSDIGNSYY